MVFLARTLVDGADVFENYWNKSISKPRLLVSALDGSRKDVSFLNTELLVSPGGKFILYWNDELGRPFTYETATGMVTDLTKNIDADWIEYKNDLVGKRFAGAAGWLPNDEWVLLYDQFDVWKVDPLGHKQPVNLTKDYGTKHRI